VAKLCCSLPPPVPALPSMAAKTHLHVVLLYGLSDNDDGLS
jgi:hypothetical protein